jgi:hypothetical protein
MKTNPIELAVVKNTAKTVTFTVKNENRELESFTASNGIEIACRAYPAFNNFVPRLYAQGSNSILDDEEIVVSAAQYKKISAAVAEYNEKFGEKPMPRPVPRPADKLSLKIEEVKTNSTSNVVAFKIVEQSGFERGKEYSFGEVVFITLVGPDYVNYLRNALYVRGRDKSYDDNVICVTTAEFQKIEAAIKLLNDSTPKFIEKITFLYTKDGTKTRRCLNVVKKDATSYEGVDEDKGEYRKFLVKNMSKIEVIK